MALKQVTAESLKEFIGESSHDLDEIIIDFLVGLINDFEGDLPSLQKDVSGFFPQSVGEEEAKQICSSIYDYLGLAHKRVEDEFVQLEEPVNVGELSKRIAAEVRRDIGWMDENKVIYVARDGEELGNFTRKARKDKKRVDTKPLYAPPPNTFVKRRGTVESNKKDILMKGVDIGIGGRTLIENSVLKLPFGCRYGLVGKNGMGKTTLLRNMSGGELPIPTSVQILHVEQEVVGDNTTALNSVLEADVERATLLREQKLLEKLENPTEEQEVRLGEVYQILAEIGADNAQSAAASILSGLGFTSEMQQKATKKFSGGWRMRIALARALFCEPDLLLLDEPTNMLDIRAVTWLANYLTDVWKNSLLIVSHDREFLNQVVTDIIHLSNKELNYYHGNYDIFEKLRNERLKTLRKAAEAQTKQRQHIQSFIDRFRFNAKRASIVQSRIKMLAKMDVVHSVVEDPTITFSFENPPPLEGVLVDFQDVGFGYDPENIMFPKINLTLRLDSRVALVGENGQGKTTILNLIMGGLRESKGYIQRHPRCRMAKFSQHHVDGLDVHSTPLEFLAKEFPGRDNLVYRSHLGKYGITGDLALQQILTLSGGQKSRVVFAHLAMKQPHLLILDEPTNHLDIETVDVLAMALNDFTGGILLVSHDRRLINLVCNELWEVKNGTLKPFKGDFNDYTRKLEKEFEQSQH